MAVRKNSNRDALQELKDLEETFKALAHRSRRHVLVVLHARGGTMTAGEIARRFSCSWPTTSRHLKQLEEAGLVSVERNGREWIYAIAKNKLQQVLGDWLAEFNSPEQEG